MALEAIQKGRLYSQIADRLCELIRAGDYPPGSFLPSERELAAALEVSRSSVREALIALEVLGVVDVRVGAGMEVLRVPDAAATRDLMAQLVRINFSEPDPELPVVLDLSAEIPPFALLQARRLVEPETAALAARHATPAQIDNLRTAFARNQRDNREGSRTNPGDRQFHIAIAQASGNPAYEMLITLLLGHRYSPLFQHLQRLYTPENMALRSEREHEAVLQAIIGRDADQARARMAAHLESVIAIFARE
ncbi:FadR family transcriptional regulator [Acidisoma cellulosilytica]|uniref:FadR family transcriptional regulator n=1 Tax=Acidisoma cellulosilyticum TaxID=2802395 RepID=A0A963Z155_9PROT|nr:FadR/GntR family transcriptional regulator [Acidisoma cellulosilyticum]MCB8880957.1 FadR family transcriptional regulator [Acidisoma cellulosilyticum]